VRQAPLPAAESSAQRTPEPAEADEGLRRKPLASASTPFIQRHSMPGANTPEELKEEQEEQPVRRKPDPARAESGAGFEAGDQFESRLASSQGGGSGLSTGVRRDMESRFGADFGSVRVHADGTSGQLNR